MTFRIIEGGLTEGPQRDESGICPPLSLSEVKFRGAWVTNSRLMGVCCLSINWQLPGDPDDPGFMPSFQGQKPKPHLLRQYFYFDWIETGLDRFEYRIDPDPEDIEILEGSLIGGLGSDCVSVPETEALFLVQEAVSFSRREKQELPEPSDWYLFLLTEPQNMNEAQRRIIFSTTCTPISSPIELANYFLMRCCELDRNGVRFLSEGRDIPFPFGPDHWRTFHRNDVEIDEEQHLARCRSLTWCEDTSRYEIFMTELEWRQASPGRSPAYYVTACRLISRMEVTDQEAYLNLSHVEYATIYELDAPKGTFRRGATRLTRGAVINEENGGRTFMIFNPTNDHAKRTPYFLSGDLRGIYFLNEDETQIVASSATREGRFALDMDLMLTEGLNVSPGAAYQFNEPVMNTFLTSGIGDFREFIRMVTQPERGPENPEDK